ncbi:MAG: hypothetical protein H6701_14085 [Myxococcales bacterium]|nr:hypothetical protein [Myxococcales bacterium]
MNATTARNAADAPWELVDHERPARLVLRGHLDPLALDGLLAEVEGWQPPTRDLPCVVDLSAVTSYTPDARGALVAVNRALADKVGRHVYLARSARMRGLSLWVMHMAGDIEGRPVGSENQVTAWLGDDRNRLDVAFTTVLGEGRTPKRARQGPAPRLTLAERFGAQSLSWLVRITQGYWPAFTRELVRTYGLDGMKQWGEVVEKTATGLTTRFGDEIAQVVIAMSAVWNGCAYCTVGHLYAANILYFRRTGRLFPIDEREVPRWHTLTDERLEATTIERLAGDEFAELRRVLARQFQLRREGNDAVADDDDRLIVGANAAWDLVNECSILVETAHIPPLHPAAARARGVQRAYAQKRGREMAS